MQILFERNIDKRNSSVQNDSSWENDKRFQSIRQSAHQDFITLFRKSELNRSMSLPRFHSEKPVFSSNIEDPSDRCVPLSDFGKNLEDSFMGFSMANPKVRCIARDKIIFREDFEQLQNRVRIISSAVGLWGDFVGRGMLTCIVLGTHGSPKPRVICTALRELNKTADRGILAIIPNNYEDKINWGLSLARVNRKGIKVKSFTFGDNAYNDGKSKDDERSCLPGIVICYKLAGAMSEERLSLAVINDKLKTMFFTTISCHIGDPIRMGTDLNGKGGFEMVEPTKEEVMKEVFDSLFDPRRRYSAGYDPGTEFVILINTYLADWALAQTISVEIVSMLKRNRHVCSRIYSGNLVPSVSAGFSVTVLPEGSEDIVSWLDRYTSCLGWLISGNGNVQKYRLSIFPAVMEASGMWFNDGQADMMRIAVEMAACNFKQSEIYLNSIDPKGSYGSNMFKICLNLLECLTSDPSYLHYPYMLFTKLSECFEHYFKIIDGLMFSLFAVSVGQYFNDHPRPPRRINEKMWERALKRGVKSVAGYYKIGYKDHTLLDIFGSLYLIMNASGLDVLSVLQLALEVGDDQCWKVKYAKKNKIIECSYLTMRSACIILSAVATMLQGTEPYKQLQVSNENGQTASLTAMKIKEILTAE